MENELMTMTIEQAMIFKLDIALSCLIGCEKVNKIYGCKSEEEIRDLMIHLGQED